MAHLTRHHRADTPGKAPWVRRRQSAVLTRRGDGLAAVLFDRDGTLIEDVAYNHDPGAVFPIPGAREAVAEVRSRGLAVGVVTDQSGVARGILNRRQVENVNRRVDDLFGAFDVWAVCPHAPRDGCDCRRPAPGLVLAAAKCLGVDASRVAVVGDLGADLRAAYAAGATGVLVPTRETPPEEIPAVSLSAADLPSAVNLLLRESPDGGN
ncbi:D-glycero-alpha-D-manno-heptose-1,7-bisphosphate 7-phosphatase [Kitasatospora sp. NPDC048365]|uniref:D-glycero-alpha-D-manno-heptose-1,7-bisphosphate 7-phosphatase n=1 Tax=Kitasatospora sp. NPDC048365 TaxID=3364050 RepID=UPI00371A6651